jgi:hypothetical protein
MNRQDDFRNRLVAAQQFTPEYREKYREGLENMFTRQLTPMQRALVSVLVLLGLAVIALYVYIGMRYTTPGGRYTLVFLGLIVLAITAIRLMIVVTGKVHLRWQSKTIAYIAFYGFLVFAMGTLIAAFNVNDATIALVGAFPLLLAIAKVILVHIQESELNVRQKLLEIELKLAEMNEALAGKQG